MTNPPDSGDTDSSNWSAPGGQWGAPDSSGYSSTPGSAGPESAGQYSQPGQYAQPGQYGQPSNQPGHSSPPPQGDYIPTQPGIIPLRPLGLGQIYDGAFKAIRTNPTVMFVFAAVVVIVITIIESILSASFFNDYFSLLGMADDPAALEAITDDDILGMLTGSVAPLLIGAVVTFVGTTILNGVLTLAVSQAVLGFKPSLGQVWDQAKGQILRLLGLVLLIGIITAIVPIALVALTIAAGVSGSVGLTVLLGLISAIASLMWVLFVIAATALATPALMLERSGVLAGLRRGWQLAKPFFWRILGIYLLTALIGVAVSYIVSMPAGIAVLFLPPTGMIVAQGIATVIASTLITPFTAGVLALLYIDVRIRREGLAAELAAASQ